MATMTNGKLEGFLKKSIYVVEISDGLTFFLALCIMLRTKSILFFADVI